jgi:hypothetical protein
MRAHSVNPTDRGHDGQALHPAVDHTAEQLRRPLERTKDGNAAPRMVGPDAAGRGPRFADKGSTVWSASAGILWTPSRPPTAESAKRFH